MCNWRKWILPGILATIVLTALAMLFHSSSIEEDLTAKASGALQAEHPWASVDLDGRDLTLSGVAPSEDAQAAAATIADNAYDVRVVADATSLPPIEDPYKFSAVKNADGITLSGFVPADDVRAEIVSAAETANPGIAVTDNMTIARGAPAGFGALTAFGLSQLGGLADGEASLSNSEYSISGTAATVEAFADETDKLTSALPGGGTLASADITPPTISPYTWSATKAAGGAITLAGLMPSVEARDRIAVRAAELNPDVEIDNRMMIAAGAPDGFVDAADYSLGFLPNFLTGSASLTDADMTVRGRAPDGNAFGAAAALEGEVPDGINIATEVTLPAATGPYQIVATKSPDVVTLQGFAPSVEAKAAIVEAAEGLGVNVVDRIEVATGAPDGVDWGAAGAYAVSGLESFTSGTATLRDTDLSVNGETADGDFFAAANAAWDRPLPEGVSIANEDIRLPVASPYVWEANFTDRVTIDGVVPSEDVKTANTNAAMDFFGEDVTVLDTQTLASGAPRGFEAATSVGLRSISRMEQAYARITDTQLEVVGTAFSPSAKNDIERKVANGIPPGFTGATNISVRPAPLEPGGLGVLEPEACQAQLNNLLTSGQIRFATNEAVIEEDSFGLLDRLAYSAQSCPDAQIEIAGHTDSDGSEAYNQGLSERRAVAVVNYLVVAGVSSARLSAVGFGETQPIASNDTAEGKAQNRRIEFNVQQ